MDYTTIIHKSFKELWPEKELKHELNLKYSGKFSDYNANVNYTTWKLNFKLSKTWRGVDEDIRIGLIQSLLIKVFKTQDYKNYAKNNKVELYNMFLKNVALVAPRKESDSMLVESFLRVNETYFNGLMDMPNLLWGQRSLAKLGSYEYGSDTVTISTVLKETPLQILDYVVYHELLHKKHKFYHKNGKSYHHTTIFRNDEKKFENSEQLEREIKTFLRKKKVKRMFWGLFD